MDSTPMPQIEWLTKGKSIPQSEWKIGDRVAQTNDGGNIHPFYGVWFVHEIQERGLVVSLKSGAHKHLMDWSRVNQGTRVN